MSTDLGRVASFTREEWSLGQKAMATLRLAWRANSHWLVARAGIAKPIVSQLSIVSSLFECGFDHVYHLEFHAMPEWGQLRQALRPHGNPELDGW